MIKNLKKLEVINIIMDDNNLHLVPVKLSNKGADTAMLVGDLDFDISNPEWFPDKKYLNDNYSFTIPFVEIEEHIFISDILLVNSSLENKIIGTIRGYNYHNEKEFNRLDFENEKELVLALRRGKIDYAIISKLPALYWANLFKVSLTTHSVHSGGHLHFRFPKNNEHLIPLFNKSINKFLNNGTIEEIIEKYTQ